jgi:CRP/FNR family transcriptional regulator, dissimilatory nitrate respiration regulator
MIVQNFQAKISRWIFFECVEIRNPIIDFLMDMKMEKMNKIAMIPIFQGLPNDQIKDLAEIAITKQFQRGETVFSEGQPALGFYVVESGRIRIYKISPEGKEQILHIFGPGEPFGEVPVFEGKRFPANAEAMEKSSFLFFPRVDFIYLIKNNPSLALNMLAVLSRRLRKFAALVDDLALKEVPGRLAAHFLYVSGEKDNAAEIELDISKGQLASLVGTIPETLSRILAKMVKSGLIVSDGPKITIMDRSSLIDLAQGLKRL